MKKSKSSETQFVSMRKHGDVGMPIKQLCREPGIRSATYERWKSRYGGLDAADPR